MVASIVPHSLFAIPHSELATVIEIKDPTLMSLTPLEELAIACSKDYAHTAAYSAGLFEERLIDSLRVSLAG